MTALLAWIVGFIMGAIAGALSVYHAPAPAATPAANGASVRVLRAYEEVVLESSDGNSVRIRLWCYQGNMLMVSTEERRRGLPGYAGPCPGMAKKS